MAAPSTPTNFNLQTGNGNNFLSWDITSGATSYKVKRSLDGVTYSVVATITGSPLHNYYLDSAVSGSNPGGVTAGTKYYYEIAASNSDGDSAYSAAQDIVPAAVGQVSLQWIRLMALLRADLYNSQFISLPEANSYISNSYKALYDILVQKYGDDYLVATPYTFTTDGGSTLFPLPADFYKLLGVEVALNPNDPNSWITLRKFEFVQRNLWNYPNVYTFYGITNLRYRLNGSNLMIVPIASANQTIRIWYCPRPNILMKDTDLLDGISGWEDYVILDAARKMLLKQEQDTSEIVQEMQFIVNRIEQAAENRDPGEPETVSDSKMRNFSWIGNGDGGWGSSGGQGW